MTRNRIYGLTALLTSVIALLSIIVILIILRAETSITIYSTVYVLLIGISGINIVIAIFSMRLLIKNIRSEQLEFQRKIDVIHDYYQYENMMNPTKIDT